ncbi:MAG: DUF58 domain-containing protein [Planctomycetes bacterium]|nr:DUF58 domain-containing protein [Planctomycetota bacterium]
MSGPRHACFDPAVAARLGRLNLLARRAVDGMVTGLHRSGRRGFSVEFSEHRQYTPGDDLRHLDWIAYARSDRHYIKQYEQETNLHAHLLLDLSASMDYGYGGHPTKLRYAACLAAQLAYLMVRQADQVGLIGFDRDVRFHLPPASTAAHLDRLFTHLDALSPGADTALADVLDDAAARIAGRGLIVILSDLYDDPDRVLRAMERLRRRRHQVILIHVLDRAELDLPHTRDTTFVDRETGRALQVDPEALRETYVRQVEAFIGRYRRECGSRRMDYVLAPTDTPYDRMLMDYLARRRHAKR